MVIHTGEKANKCNQCDASFIRKYGLLRHLKRHNIEEKTKYSPRYGPELGKTQIKHNCNICDYQSTSKQCLKMHTASKHLGTGHGCNVCGYQAYTASMLKYHMMIHNSEKTNKCNQCDYSSVRKQGLLRHMETHNNEEKTKYKPKYGPDLELHGYYSKLVEGKSIGKFQCNLCGKISNTRNQAFKHVESIHFPNSYQYDCDQCGEKFGTKNKFLRHCWNVHSSKKHIKEKPKKPQNYEKLQTIVKLGLHLAMEKNGAPQTGVRSTSDGDFDGDDVKVLWSDYCDTVEK